MSIYIRLGENPRPNVYITDRSVALRLLCFELCARRADGTELYSARNKPVVLGWRVWARRAP